MIILKLTRSDTRNNLRIVIGHVLWMNIYVLNYYSISFIACVYKNLLDEMFRPGVTEKKKSVFQTKLASRG